MLKVTKESDDLEESPERLVTDYMRTLGASDLADCVLDMSKYQIFDDEVATAVSAPRGTLGGITVWNLEPGQENDYHRHPENEHYQIVIEGELEFTLGDQDPVLVRPGQIVVIPTNVPHGIRNTSDGRGTYVAFTSPGAYEKVLVRPPVRD